MDKLLCSSFFCLVLPVIGDKSDDLDCQNRAFGIFLNELLESSRCLRKTLYTYIQIVGKNYFTLE